jgi:hypothetical protein
VFAVLFATPLVTAAVAAGAASVPVIIHLLSRKRYRIVDWAAMRFLLAAQKQNLRRLRLEQWLLLAVRTLSLLLLIAAMAAVAPWAEALWQRLLPGGIGASVAVAGRTHKVIVLDGTLSMTLRRDDGGTGFDRAKALAAELARSSSAGDGLSVVLLASPAQAVVPGPAEEAGKVAHEIDGLRCTHGAADLGQGLAVVEDLLRRSPGKFAQREVYFLTDLQRSAWTLPPASTGTWAEAWGRIQTQAQVVMIDVGRDGADNLAVTNLALAEPLAVAGTRAAVTATVHNFGAGDRPQVRAELFVGRSPLPGTAGEPFALRKVQEELLAVPAGGSAGVSFPVEFRAAGEYVVQVRLEGDALEADDVRTLTVPVRDVLPVLVVNGKPAAERLETAAAWLADALDPFPASAPRNPLFPARPKVVGESQFADASAGDLSAYDCVFLCDVPRLSEREAARLESHLKRGGGVVIGLGPHVDLEAYNRLLYRDGAGILPAKLVGQARAPAGGFFTLAADDEQFQRAPLAAFAADNDRASLLNARFSQYVRVEVAAHAPVRRLLSLLPAGKPDEPPRETEVRPGALDPLVLEWPRHRGRVVLVTSTFNTDWTSWPIAPSFPPFVQELLRFAVARPPQRTLGVGEPIEELLPPGLPAGDAAVTTPDGRTVSVSLEAGEDATRLRFAETDQSGLYRVALDGARRELLYAVNVPGGGSNSESDLRRLNPADLRGSDGDVQIVTELRSIRRVPKRVAPPTDVAADAEPPPVHGPALARFALFAIFVLLVVEVVLAWRFGSARAGKVPSLDRPADTAGRRWLDRALALLAAAPLAACAIGAVVLLHAAVTDNLLGFLPDAWRHAVEASLGVPPAAAGEGTRWRLDYLPFLTGHPTTDRWLVGAVAVGVLALVGWIYARELPRKRFARPAAWPPVGLRAALLLLTLCVLLPQLRLLFEREGWPDLVILIDDSASMGTVDDYQDPQVKEAADKLAKLGGFTRPQRLQLAQALVTRGESDLLTELLTRRQAKLHLFHCSTQATRLGEVREPDQIVAGAEAVRKLQATGPSSQLGSAVRSVLQEFRGSALAGIVMLTDGVTTDGDDLPRAAQDAAKAGVPLYLVGLGDAREPRDLVLSDLQVEDSVHVGDRLVFEARVTVHGSLAAGSVPVTLYEKLGDQLKELARQQVTLDKAGRPVKVRLTHTPTEAGERVYVLDVPVLPDESDPANNRLERSVFVAEFQRTRVLYVEGYPRYEFRFVKALLERESAATRANKTVELKVLLADADPDYFKQDKSAVEAFPSTRDELFTQYDVVILGDVDPRHPKLGERNLQWIAEFVREKGGGLLLMAGPRAGPGAYRDTPLADVLPVEGPAVPPPETDRTEGYRLRLTPVGQMHPLFRFVPDEAENQAVWQRLAKLYWSADGCRPKPAAEVLAVKPPPGADESADPTAGEPLVVQQFVGAGRSMFFGFDETWRWRQREDERRFNQFWVQAVRYLARARQGRIELRTDKQTPYHRGEPIRLTARFPDDQPPPAAGTAVRVAAERQVPGGGVETQALQLAKLEGTRATYEALVTRTPEGAYRFTLTAPAVGSGAPKAESRVLPPPGELDLVRMNQPDLERAAAATRGRFYTLAEADRLVDELPALPRVTLNQPRPPWPVWNHPLLFGLALALVSGEWILRKRQQLL